MPITYQVIIMLFKKNHTYLTKFILFKDYRFQTYQIYKEK